MNQIEPTARRRRLRRDRGAVTAEYAMLTVAGISGLGVLLKLLTDPWFLEQVKVIILAIINIILSVIKAFGA